MEMSTLELYRSSLFLLADEITEIFSPQRVATVGGGGYDIAQCLRARGVKVHHRRATGNIRENSRIEGTEDWSGRGFKDIDLLIIAPYLIPTGSSPDDPQDGSPQGNHLQGDDSQDGHAQNAMNSLDLGSKIASQAPLQLNEFMNDYESPSMVSLLCVPPPYYVQGLRSSGAGGGDSGHPNAGSCMKMDSARTELKHAELGDGLHEIDKLTKQIHTEITDVLLRSGQYETSYHALGGHDEWSVYAYMSDSRLDWYTDLLQEMLESTQLLRYRAEFELEHLKKAFSDAQLSRSWKIAYRLAGVLYRNKASDSI